MLSRSWWSASPSSAWVSPDRGSDERSGVWELSKGRDPLSARSLTHWADYGREEGVQLCGNSEALLAEHLALAGRVIRTRFPPEPNGYLHIGHAKSMNMNFKLAFEKLEAAVGSGSERQTIFRYDDTNPTKESKEFVESLRRDVEWMGWKPYQVTHTSDYFDALYSMAVELVKAGKAYACEQTSAEIEACRAVAKARASLRKLREAGAAEPPELVAEARLDVSKAHESPYRDRPVEESLAMFERMRRGYYPEGAMTLRLKMDSDASNYNMFDQVAYRIKFHEHPQTGDRWCVYPTYDYTHCIIDSLEHVDYSICTLEFETRRESYYWVLDALDVYRPRVFEMSRLNLTYTVLSKRKLTKLVEAGIVRGWDDPRMPTISGLRRRGYSPDALNAFCDDVGVTRNENYIEYSRLQHFARLDLEPRAPRRMAVCDPLKIVLVAGKTYDQTVETPDGSVRLRVAFPLFIDAKDFRERDDPNFFGLAPGKVVRLRHAINVKCEEVRDDAVVCSLQDDSLQPKGKLHWVSAADAVECELRDYNHLFTVPKVDDDVWESQINTETSEVVHPKALAHRDLVLDRAVQFERLGFYVKDKDSTEDRIVFNRIVELRAPDLKKQGVSRKETLMAQLAKKEALKSLDPREMFRDDPQYTKFDEDGVPTHGKDQEPLAKNAVKKLKKEWAKQKRFFEANQQQPVAA